MSESPHVKSQWGNLCHVHLPTSLYVGQTINSAYHRLRSHWNGRHNDDFRNTGLHNAMRKSKSIKDFLIWPLELIPKELYYENNIANQAHFCRIAAISETYSTNKLHTLVPKGFNIFCPSKISTRNRRPKKYSSK